ncbi:Glutamate synthase [NADPH] small chain [Aquisphaera giovannonii]|uniref:Glutamate synthase [NADPH] small chain n=1 Tax=Aquisphaera giovannonii TaxID=406548 RepID=A0A5B9VWI0_9BACT|nr:glutamate synthase subunit beta [Aquisphaera giovannonii]QEH32135.1 Glutamate synthase [NADPH] small chain [Aquisphaera giovannonii]
MADPRGFLNIDRQKPTPRPVHQRIKDYLELYQPMPAESVRAQASRCMDCGIPFCQDGCPLGNRIPDWNDLVHRNRWKEALDALHDTNNFPEFTGKTCPAPCEASCVLALSAESVTIKEIEASIVDRGWENGWIVPRPPARETGKRVAIVGSGPAGLAAAQQLRHVGHAVTVFERDDRAGGLLAYGIPDFKMAKRYVERRIDQLVAEGVRFELNAEVGRSIDPEALRADHDAVLLTVGATRPRELDIPGRGLEGIVQAMSFLTQQNRRGFGLPEAGPPILATGRNVIVIGGGDTAADCVGTCHRQQARSVLQLDYNPMPPEGENPDTPWPLWPKILRVAPAHEEGGRRDWQIKTKAFHGDGHGRVKELAAVRVHQYYDEAGDRQFEEIHGSELIFPAELVLLAIGFAGPEGSIPDALGLEMTEQGAIRCDPRYMTSREGVFAAGDCRRGQSLVVWAIAEGREAARGVDEYLTGRPSALRARDRSPTQPEGGPATAAAGR